MNTSTIFNAIVIIINANLFLVFWLNQPPHTFSQCINQNETRLPLVSEDTKHLSKLVELAREIKYAKQHVRGTKTGDSLLRTTRIVSDMLQLFGLDFENITKRNVQQSKNVCPEKYMGAHYGYPLYYTGFVVDNCSYAKPLESLVTVLINFKSSNVSVLEKYIESVWDYNVHLFIIINTPIIAEKLAQFGQHESVTFTQFSGTVGYIWNQMVEHVKTPYVLIARDVIWFNDDVRLDRLIRQIERLDISVAGGSFRNASGHWFIGCQQRVFRNFTLVYEAGYDVSIEGCQFCDHIDGPFVTKTHLLETIKFNKKIRREGIFEDWFMRLGKRGIVVCPDSMFFTHNLERSRSPKDWRYFAHLRSIYKITFSGREINIPCLNYPCYTVKNSAISPCCQKELSELINTGVAMCKNAGVLCEIYSGTALGAVKFHSILPWEQDADIMFLTANYSSILKETKFLNKQGYNLMHRDTRKKMVNSSRQTGGLFTINSHHSKWKLEMFGFSYLGSEREVNKKQPQTHVNVNGYWVGITRNPGLYSSNRYQKEIYHHAQHWRHTGLQDSWKAYRTNYFKPCGMPGHQACLDRYNADGNLQFRDPIP